MANVAAATTPGVMRLLAHYPADAGSLLPRAIGASKKIGPGAKLVYSKLLTYAATSEVATNNRLATELGVSPRSISNYVAELRSAGLLKVRLQAGKPSSYTLTRTI